MTWAVTVGCGRCFFCAEGIGHKCERLAKYGHEPLKKDHPLTGGLAEYCHLLPRTSIFHVPEVLTDTVACPAGCATATVAAAMRAAGSCKDRIVLVQGAGMLGLTACAMARSHGASRVVITDVAADRLHRAKEFGATDCLMVGDNSMARSDAIPSISDGRGVDLALEMSGSPDAIETGIQALRIGGRYVLVGSVHPTRAITIEPETIVRRLLSIHGIHNYIPADLETGLRFLAENHEAYPWDSLVDDGYCLADVNAALTTAQAHHAARVAVKAT